MQSPLFGGHGRFASLGAGLRAVGLTSHARNFVAATSIAAVGSVAYVRSWKEPPPKSPSQYVWKPQYLHLSRHTAFFPGSLHLLQVVIDRNNI